jgi:hypothetical protein
VEDFGKLEEVLGMRLDRGVEEVAKNGEIRNEMMGEEERRGEYNTWTV